VISAYLANRMLQVIAAGDVWVSLHRDDPGLQGQAEILGGQYERQLASFQPPSGGYLINAGAYDFDDLPEVTLTHAGLWDAASAGNFLWGVKLTREKRLDWGDSFRIARGNLSINFTELTDG
jgi:hypothetical protein